jgi:hypothetical protein
MSRRHHLRSDDYLPDFSRSHRVNDEDSWQGASSMSHHGYPHLSSAYPRETDYPHRSRRHDRSTHQHAAREPEQRSRHELVDDNHRLRQQIREVELENERLRMRLADTEIGNSRLRRRGRESEGREREIGQDGREPYFMRLLSAQSHTGSMMDDRRHGEGRYRRDREHRDRNHDESPMPTISEESIAALPTRYLTPADFTDDSPTAPCAICLDEKAVGDEVTTLACGHWFDRDCLRQWLLPYHKTCPTCRQAIPGL